MNFNTIRSEGALIASDLLSAIQSGEALGQKTSDFGLDGKIRLLDEVAACWSDAKAYWMAFQHGLNRIKEGDTAATVTREQWILPLLRTFGFDKITFAKSAALVGGETYFISHRLGDGENGLPIYIEGARNELDRRPPTGRPRISPHALVQEYLNRTDHLWGIVTNGLQFRILRDSERLSRPAYLEFDLQQIMEGEHFAEFQVFYRIVHRSRWPKDIETASECLLEQYYQQGIETGGRVREHLRDGVEQALRIFGNGFLSHPENHVLRQNIKEGKLDASDYYRQLLRLVYRFLFLMVSEERNLVGPDPENDHFRKIYDHNYSISRLREKVERPVNMDEKFWDLWEGVKQAFKFYSYENFGGKIGIAPLNGDLFGPRAMPNLENAFLYNRDFLRGFAHLSIFKDNRSCRRINYAHLDVEELGSVYESLLDYHPISKDKDGTLTFELAFGTERKSTGSYYTRPELVQELIKSALVPVMEERLNNAKTKEEKEKALLSMKVCDPAAGSGHFLLAAARRIGKELAKVRTGEDQPTPSDFRLAVRDVIQHCIYGVDLNPLAVDLCKVALWLEGHNRGYPLTFLDHRIKCGNSLIGLDKLERLKDGIPDDAFKPVTGDDKEVAKKIKARNRQERKDWEKGFMQLPFDVEDKLVSDLKSFAEQAQSIDAISEKSPEDVNKKQDQYEKIRADERWWKDWTAANIWTSAFFYPLTKIADPAIPTHEKLMNFMLNPKAAHGQLIGKINALSARHRFFHWPLEFPEIAKAGGFDIALGNPPWERIKLQEQEFFATRDPEIANAPNKAARTRLINKLAETNPDLLINFEEAKHDAESDSRFVREGGRYPLTAVGDVNTYALFSELSRGIISPIGRLGIIVPTGIATDDTTKNFIANIMNTKCLISIVGFENEARIFPTVHNAFKFCALTIGGNEIDIEEADFVFLCRYFEHSGEEERHFSLSVNDIALINPNTYTTPIFRTKKDAELVKKIYEIVPVLINEKEKTNIWNISFLRMFDMANDSELFLNKSVEGAVPLYEAKMIHQFDHRFSTYQDATQEQLNAGRLPQTTPHQKQDPNFEVLPRYWIPASEVLLRLGNWDHRWLIGFRNITSSVVERTSIFSFMPLVAVGHSIPLIFISKDFITKALCLLSNFNILVLDYIVRQKIGGNNLTFFILKQLPVLRPEDYQNSEIEFISGRTLELVYTDYHMRPLAEDMGYDGHPFKWDEERRAILRAELDAFYAKLYGLTRDELRYILDPQDIYGPNFPGETFRVLKEKEIKQYGEYRTRRLVLEAWDRLFGEK
ncbi:MAG: restriction endonuclease [Nitrospira sp.]|nr:restriction endonuclease [Nitrospira sp.]